MSRGLPSITHLQFLILEALAAGEQAGRDLRALLATHGIRNSAPAFYQMMARLEAARLVDGRYDQRVVHGQLLKERRYKVLPEGRRALAETRNFYLSRAGSTRRVRGGSHA
jgi:DNA-binding PadR family transcriptional regulator